MKIVSKIVFSVVIFIVQSLFSHSSQVFQKSSFLPSSPPRSYCAVVRGTSPASRLKPAPSSVVIVRRDEVRKKPTASRSQSRPSSVVTPARYCSYRDAVRGLPAAAHNKSALFRAPEDMHRAIMRFLNSADLTQLSETNWFWHTLVSKERHIFEYVVGGKNRREKNESFFNALSKVEHQDVSISIIGNLGEVGWQQLIQYMPKIPRLQVYGKQADQFFSRFLPTIARNGNLPLQELSLRKMPLPLDLGVTSPLIPSALLGRLKVLRVTHCGIGEETIPALVLGSASREAEDFLNLTTLDFSSNALNDPALALLAICLLDRTPNLETLLVSNNKPKDGQERGKGVEELLDTLKSLRSLRVLDMRGYQVSRPLERGIKALGFSKQKNSQRKPIQLWHKAKTETNPKPLPKEEGEGLE